jgi:hypothetical protein
MLSILLPYLVAKTYISAAAREEFSLLREKKRSMRHLLGFYLFVLPGVMDRIAYGRESVPASIEPNPAGSMNLSQELPANTGTAPYLHRAAESGSFRYYFAQTHSSAGQPQGQALEGSSVTTCFLSQYDFRRSAQVWKRIKHTSCLSSRSMF